VRYPGGYVKIDLSYLARVPLLEPDVRECALAEPTVSFPVLQLPELVAGKVKALVERRAARDLYDLWRMASRAPDHFGDPLARALAFYAIGASDPFPFVTDPVRSLRRFENPSPEFAEPLYAMLRPEEVPEYGSMLSQVADWLSPLSSPTPNESKHSHLLDANEFRPELLFSAWPDVGKRAFLDPVMAWKVRNLKKRETGEQ
jgi:hypothetical protein